MRVGWKDTFKKTGGGCCQGIRREDARCGEERSGGRRQRKGSGEGKFPDPVFTWRQTSLFFQRGVAPLLLHPYLFSF